MSDSSLKRELSSKRDVTAPRSMPNRAWVCGYAELGCPCKTGPTADGRCGRLVRAEEAAAANATADKSPTATSDDAEAMEFCIPRRSIPASRHLLSMYLALATGMTLLLCMLLPSREQIFVPGDLSHKHAQILDNTLVSQRCSLCHPASHGSDWLQSMTTDSASLATQDALCMRCHTAHIPRGTERLAHDLSPEDLLRPAKPVPAIDVAQNRSPGSIRARLVSTGLEGKSPSDQSANNTGIPEHKTASQATSCAWCHMEHHGRQFDLKLITDARCQACHQAQFESFSRGHPEFTDYPQQQPRSLSFTHTAHRDKHFPQKNKSFDCRTCHVDGNHPSGVGPVSRSLGFERTCAECHREPIRMSMSEGWTVLSLPSIEQSDAKAGSDLHSWPTGGRFGYEGKISPILRALLAADPQVQNALRELPPSGNLTEVPAARRPVITRVIASGTQRLVQEIGASGQKGWRSRLERLTEQALGRPCNAEEKLLLDRTTADIPPDLFRMMLTKWFIADGGSQSKHANNDDDVSIRPVAFAELNPPSDLLDAEVELTDGRSGPVPSSDSLLLNEPKAASTPNSPKKNGFSRMKGMEHLPAGGWYLDDDTLSLMKLPTGHADPTLTAWHEWLRLATSTDLGRDLGFTLAGGNNSSQAILPGSCMQCHSIMPQADISEVHHKPSSIWSASRRSPLEKPFTKFDHSPHLSLPAVRDCRHCHALETPSSSHLEQRLDSLAQAPLLEAKKLVSTQTMPHTTMHPKMNEFKSIERAQCNACHRSGGAAEGCTQCHNYHIRPPESNVSGAAKISPPTTEP